MASRALLTVLSCALVGCSGQIQTGAPSPSTTRPVQSHGAAPDTTLFLLDGRLIRRGDVNKIDPAQVAGIRHLVGPAARAQYGPSVREIVEITTKATADTSARAAPLYFLDGTEIPAHLARVLDSKKIASIDVLKGAAARSYGSRAHGGVVLVKTKAGSE